ncbi:hypothetical protein, partial [Nocardia cyriacigeorgica]|uniref:hypothetical protein n=1 Tax=Nocardia cyriacigeorgica TaxID=135487 RepID=UPI0018952F57
MNSLQILAPGIVPDSYIDAIAASCSRASEFLGMWTQDVSNADIHNNELTVLDPTRREHVAYTMTPYRPAASRGRWEMLVLNPAACPY